MFNQIKNKLKTMLKGEDEPVVNFIPNIMKRVHEDPDGNLASRMNRQFIPLADIFTSQPPTPHKVWRGDKINKAIRKGTCAGTRVEGVVAGAIRLAKQERMLDKIASIST